MGTSSNTKTRNIAFHLAKITATIRKGTQVLEISVARVREYVEKGWKRVN